MITIRELIIKLQRFDSNHFVLITIDGSRFDFVFDVTENAFVENPELEVRLADLTGRYRSLGYTEKDLFPESANAQKCVVISN